MCCCVGHWSHRWVLTLIYHSFGYQQSVPASNWPRRLAIATMSTTAEVTIKTVDEPTTTPREAVPITVVAISRSNPNPDIQHLRAEVTRLAERVASLTTHCPCRGRSLSRNCRTHSPAPTNSLQPQDSLCWYHMKFGETAKKCQEQCSWGNNQAGH